MNKQRTEFNWGVNKFLQTLLCDVIVACFPIVIPDAIRIWPLSLTVIIGWTLRDLVCKRLSAAGAKRFNMCVAVLVGVITFASVLWGHQGDLPNIRVIYIVLVLLVTLIHAVVVAKNGAYNTSLVFQIRLPKKHDR